MIRLNRRPERPDEESRWFSICSAHQDYLEECLQCNVGEWIGEDQIAYETELFNNDYAEWFRQKNNGRDPSNSAWTTWAQITGKPNPNIETSQETIWRKE